MTISKALKAQKKGVKKWASETHPRGDARNGEVKHWVMNWKLYQLRHKEEEEDGSAVDELPQCEAEVIPVA